MAFVQLVTALAIPATQAINANYVLMVITLTSSMSAFWT
jgi:hypothetical protein